MAAQKMNGKLSNTADCRYFIKNPGWHIQNVREIKLRTNRNYWNLMQVKITYFNN